MKFSLFNQYPKQVIISRAIELSGHYGATDCIEYYRKALAWYRRGKTKSVDFTLARCLVLNFSKQCRKNTESLFQLSPRTK